MSTTDERLDKVETTLYGDGAEVKGHTTRLIMVEKYIDTIESERQEERRERRKVVWGVYAAIIIMLLQTALTYLSK